MGILGRKWDDDAWSGGGTTWTTSSKKDPRFNMSGTAYGVLSSAWDISDAVKKRAADLGCEIPDDLESGAWKE